ncbi:MAG: MBL fold metallo-hydrolase [Bacteroidales bacterium]|nr:MBL fold metallo-hydrolase [Bacteroidales bacterium]
MKIKIFPFNPLFENTYLLYDDTKEAALIDCGASSEKEYALLDNFIESNGLTLKVLLNTHLHFDHALGNNYIREKYGLKPQYHKNEDAMPCVKPQASTFGFSIVYEPVKADHFIKEGEIIRFGNTSLLSILTPGHSPGSLSFYNKEDNCIFTGDALFKRSIGRTDLWKGDESTLLKAIRTKILTLPDETVVYPGHGPATTVIEEKKHNPYIS